MILVGVLTVSRRLNCYGTPEGRKPGEKLGRKKMNQRRTGTAYEKIAADYIRKQGIHILEKNYRISQGEVDLIGEDKEYVIFFEVKYRKTASYGYPWEAVSSSKRRKICTVARQYCYSKGIKKQVRYDVISICGDEILWFRDAFEHMGRW